MLQKIRKSWKGALGLGFLLLCLSAIINMLRAPQDTVARAADVEKAKRTEGGPNAKDFRLDLDSESGVAANGVIEPMSDEIQLAAEVPGVIEEILVKEGQKVKQNDVLVRFRGKIEKAQMDAAVADLNAAKARGQLAQKSRVRTQKLGSTGAATQEDLDRANKDASLENAQTAAALARSDQARASFERLMIKAPSDGEILKINFKIGEYYTPNATDALMILGDTRELRVRIELDERDLGRVTVGTQGHFIADAFSNRKFAFAVVDLGRRMGRKALKSDDPRERNDTRIREVYGKVADHDANLLPGLRVTAFLKPDAGTPQN